MSVIGGPSLTKNAISILVNPKVKAPNGRAGTQSSRQLDYHSIHRPLEEPIFVKVLSATSNNTQSSQISSEVSGKFYNCQLSDGEHKTDAIIFDVSNQLGPRNNPTNSTIKILGYVSSNANYNKKGHGAPTTFLCVTSFEVQTAVNIGSNGSETHLVSPKKVSGGNAGTIISEVVSFMTSDDLIGVPSSVGELETFDFDLNAAAENISTFLSSHHAMRTLHVNDSSNFENNNVSAPKKYMKAVNDFADSQLQLQFSSLSKNAGKHGLKDASNLVEQHSVALSMALSHARDPHQPHLSVDFICDWHKKLGEGGLISDAGQIRQKQVKAGLTSFGHKDDVVSELEKFVAGLKGLESRALSSSVSGSTHSAQANTSNQQAFSLVAFAAIALYGVNDIHAFNDGNGRMARIVSNWALAKAGLPFVINIFATPLQRTEYINALEKTRRNLSLVCFGDVPVEVFTTIRQMTGLFKPVIVLILDRVNRAVAECRKAIADMSKVESEELAMRAAKQFRDEAAAGVCFICMDDKPNIATLCCGKAVHLSCIALWLSSKRECPYCRGEFPSMPERAPRQNPVQNVLQPANVRPSVLEENIAEDTTTTTTDDDDGNMEENQDEVSDEDQMLNETTQDDTTDETEEPPQADDTETETQDETMDETEEAPQAEDDETETQDDTTDDTEEAPQAEDDETETQDDTMDETEEAPQAEDTETDTQDDTTTEDAANDEDVTEDTEDTTSTTDTSEVATPASQRVPHPRCSIGSCSNVAARDCDNGCCGACCQLYGYYSCTRHST